ncbi:hypothetical protein [Bacillus atrophaeus]|uniref:hypothetical protein n=1 Tax=Bacillus atrophaeus TaxID=1452 RepID=UPI0022830303|nr:hypothetical protein [Bacillus atrophaeus]MCY9204363.1 hypothetical protein [Bacillus atrophaeus]MEC0885305.1 hypothetical protein [Bacillus atrophaeus]
MRVTKNYTTDGGDRTVIGGVLEIEGGTIIKDGKEVSLGGESQTDVKDGSITYEKLAEKAVRSKNIGTGSVMEEHLNSAILDRFAAIEKTLKELGGAKSDTGTE